MAHVTDSDSVAQDQIRAFVDRIMRLREEERGVKGDIREVYAEAKANGFDKTILGKIVNYVEKRESSSAALQESEALFDLYLTAYDAAGMKNANAHTHEDEADDHFGIGAILRYGVNGTEPEPEHDPETGEITETVIPVSTNSQSATAGSLGQSGGPETSLAGVEGEANRHPIPDIGNPISTEPEAIPPVADPATVASVTGDGERTASSPDAFPGATNVTAFRTHNPNTHFLNSTLLPRLKGCVNPEACGGSHRALCYSCGRNAETASHQGGAA